MDKQQESAVKIALLAESQPHKLAMLAQRFALEHDASHPLALVQTDQRLELRQREAVRSGAVFVDFTSGALNWRRQFGGGKQEALARAVGVKKAQCPTVLDATAGLGRDAFMLAALGCRVFMLERNPVVAALLEDGLMRGYQHSEIGGWLRERLTLRHITSQQALTSQQTFADIRQPVQVIYLDPMFPHRSKSALVKHPMRLLQLLVGDDADADSLLAPACQLASQRVVVKRPASAPPLANCPAPGAIVTKKHRFDLYPANFIPA